METATTTTAEEMYAIAETNAIAALNDNDAPTDNGYGCGSSFVTIKWGTEFFKWAKKQGLVKKDAYYGWVLDTNDNAYTSATLSEEHYNEAFAHSLSAQGVHAFNHTYLN